MKKLFLICLFLLLPIICSAQCYVSCPDGAIAFSSVNSFDKLVKYCSYNDLDGFKKLIENKEILLLDPGVIVIIRESTELVAAITVEGSSKVWAISLKFITCKK
jgi:hypothetical protein